VQCSSAVQSPVKQQLRARHGVRINRLIDHWMTEQCDEIFLMSLSVLSWLKCHWRRSVAFDRAPMRVNGQQAGLQTGACIAGVCGEANQQTTNDRRERRVASGSRDSTSDWIRNAEVCPSTDQ